MTLTTRIFCSRQCDVFIFSILVRKFLFNSLFVTNNKRLRFIPILLNFFNDLFFYIQEENMEQKGK
jgi:hypothetical protein